MKIGIDCRIFSSRFTGIGRYTHELVDHIIKFNSQLENPHKIVLFFNNPEYREFKITDPHVKKVLTKAKHYSFAEQTSFLHQLNKEKLDFMHFPHFNVPIFYRRPYSVTIHDLILSRFPGKKMNRWYHRLAYNLTIGNATRKAKKVITISNWTKADLMDLLHVPEKKITVIYNGISPIFTFIDDAKKFKKTLQKYHITKEFLLYTGVWRNHKNLINLIEAFKILRKKTNLHLQLVITGKPDPYYPEIKSIVKDSLFEKEVIFPGLVNEKELVDLYNAAKIFVFPSLYEGFGLPPLESMACGTPVVASNAASIPEICGEKNALFFDPHNAHEIAAKIEFLYKDVELQVDLINKGLEHVQKFSWENMARETFDLILKCSNHSKNS